MKIVQMRRSLLWWCTQVLPYVQFILPLFLPQEERKKRLGPGGLDPIEVMETLPRVS